MTDRSGSSLTGNQPSHPSRNPSEPLARNDKRGSLPYKGEVDIIALVRSLQRTAGMTDCFRKGRADCDDVHCNWRNYCLGTHPETPPKKPQK